MLPLPPSGGSRTLSKQLSGTDHFPSTFYIFARTLLVQACHYEPTMAQEWHALARRTYCNQPWKNDFVRHSHHMKKAPDGGNLFNLSHATLGESWDSISQHLVQNLINLPSVKMEHLVPEQSESKNLQARRNDLRFAFQTSLASAQRCVAMRQVQ